MRRSIAALSVLSAMGAGLAAPPVAAQVDDSLSERVTEAEASQEQALTGMLNRLVRQGFADLRSILAQDDAYIVEAVDRDLQLRRFRLEPDTGSITEIP